MLSSDAQPSHTSTPEMQSSAIDDGMINDYE